MADIFLLFLAVRDYSAISTVVSWSHLTRERELCTPASVIDAAGARERNRIKERLKRSLI